MLSGTRTPRAVTGIITLVTILSTLPGHSATKLQSQQQQSGLSWVMQAMQTLTGGAQISSVTEGGTVVWNGQSSGSITLQSTGNTNSQVSLTTSAGSRSETRSWASDGSGPVGQWTDLQGNQHQMAQHNCWADSVWFFPALSMLSDYSDPTMVYNDLGPTQYNGHNVEHIQAYRYISGLPQDVQATLQKLTTVDYYLDSQTAIPVAMAFFVHADTDVHLDVPVVLVYSQYQAVNGIQTPFQVTRFSSGSPVYQITISSVNLG